MIEKKSELELEESVLKLEKSISLLEKRVKKQVSFRRNFAMALVRGFAGAVGATIIFGLAIALTVRMVRSINYVPLVSNIINSEAIETVINKFTVR